MAISHRNGDKGGGWTLDTLQEHNQICDALKRDLTEERDRRYSEVNLEREKALKIKEEADKAALGLAREIQLYKDEKANLLREQINSERGSFAMKTDLESAVRELNAKLEPVISFVAAQAGGEKKSERSVTNIVAFVSIIYGLFATAGVIAALLIRH